MIAALIILASIAGLAYVGTWLSQYPGYIKIGLESGVVDVNIWFFLLALLLAIVAVVLVSKVLWGIVRLPTITRRFGRQRRAAQAASLLQAGLLAMGKGQWRRAEKKLAKGARISYQGKQNTGLFLTAAAQAAQEQGASARRDQYMLEARQLSVDGEDTLASALAEAQLHLANNSPEQALSVLKPYHTSHYENVRLLELESQAYEQLGAYDKVWQRLESQKKHFSSKSAYLARQMTVAKALFVAPSSTLTIVEQVWSALPKAEKKDETLLLAYVSALINHNERDRAERVLAKALRSTYADPLIHAYTQLEAGSSRQRLQQLKQWLHARPDNAYLNYGAAKLAFQLDEIPAAQSYAERSVKAQALPESLALLGKIYEVQGQAAEALQAYRTSLGLTYNEQELTAKTGEVLPADINEKQALPSSTTKAASEAAAVAEDSATTNA